MTRISYIKGVRQANSFVLLPNITKLAKKGVVFRRCCACKRWQLVTDKLKDTWRPKDQLPKLRQMLTCDFPVFGGRLPEVTDGFCNNPGCMMTMGITKEEAQEIIDKQIKEESNG